jgi:DNA-binding MarR family transcriptional regulator
VDTGYEQLHLDRQLCYAVHSASRAVVRAYGPELDRLGLTYPQYLVMLVLWEDPGTPMAVGELGRRLRLDSGTLTPLLKRLERSGLVQRRRDNADERRVLIGLTERGVALREQAANVPYEVGAKFGLDEQKARALKAELERLVAELDRLVGPAASPHVVVGPEN